MAPSNILYRVWLARSLVQIREYGKAKVHYNAALILGNRRIPVQKLRGVRRELDELSRRRSPLLHKIRRFFTPPQETMIKMPDEKMLEDASRMIERMLDEERRRNRKSLK